MNSATRTDAVILQATPPRRRLQIGGAVLLVIFCTLLTVVLLRVAADGIARESTITILFPAALMALVIPLGLFTATTIPYYWQQRLLLTPQGVQFGGAFIQVQATWEEFQSVEFVKTRSVPDGVLCLVYKDVPQYSATIRLYNVLPNGHIPLFDFIPGRVQDINALRDTQLEQALQRYAPHLIPDYEAADDGQSETDQTDQTDQNTQTSQTNPNNESAQANP